MVNDEITLSEAKRVTAELKASILKVDALNQELNSNISELKDLNLKIEKYSKIIGKFDSKNEDEMTSNYAAHLSYLSKKIDELFKNSNLKKLEKIISFSNDIVNFSIAKLAATITVCVVAFYIIQN